MGFAIGTRVRTTKSLETGRVPRGAEGTVVGVWNFAGAPAIEFDDYPHNGKYGRPLPGWWLLDEDLELIPRDSAPTLERVAEEIRAKRLVEESAPSGGEFSFRGVGLQDLLNITCALQESYFSAAQIEWTLKGSL